MGEPGTHLGLSRPSAGKIKCMIPQRLQKKQLHGSKAKQRAAEGSALPVRLTSCVFPRPVTLIPARPGNEVRCGSQEAQLEKPQQLCASWRPQALKPQGGKAEASDQAEFAKAFRLVTVGHRRGPLGWSAAQSSQPAPSPAPFWKEMLPEAARLLPPSSSYHVTAGDIQNQEDKVRRARQRLALALEADRLAREAERMRGQEERAEDPVETGAGAAGGSGM